LLLRRVSQRLGIAEEVVRQQYNQSRQSTPARDAGRSPQPHRSTEIPACIARIQKGQPTHADRLECELAQILITVPRLTEVVCRSLGASEITNPALRTMIQVYYDWAELGQTQRGFAQLLAALDDDPAAKQLAVWLDEQARIKNLEYKLCHDAERGDDDFPTILRRLLEDLQWRREEESHHRAAIALSEAGDGAHGLDEATERQLRQLSEFHQKRATKRTRSA